MEKKRMKRKNEIVNDAIYHIFNRSIAKFKIFNNEKEYNRLKDITVYYRYNELPFKFSRFTELLDTKRKGIKESLENILESEKKIVRIIAYCFMPTHYHFILQQLEEKGIEKFIGNIQNSYAKYFNKKYERKGPLWEGRFRNVRVETNDQLLHLTRYLHLNPTTSSITEKPEDWKYSSYKEYLNQMKGEELCDYSELIDMKPDLYRNFVLSNIDYQKELHDIRKLFVD